MTTRTHGTVKDIMNEKLLYIREGDRLSIARAQILRFGVTAIPILDATHRPVGVVSLRDLGLGDEEIEPSAPARTVNASATIEDGARTLASTDLHHLVVIDDDGVAVGMVSAVDFVRALVGAEPRHPQAFARY